MARPEKCLDLSFLNVFRGILVLLKTGIFNGNLRFVVFLKTPGGELNRKLIRVDTVVAPALREIQSHKVAKNSQALGKVL